MPRGNRIGVSLAPARRLTGEAGELWIDRRSCVLAAICGMLCSAPLAHAVTGLSNLTPGMRARLFNIGRNGAAVGVANGSTLTVLQIPQATDPMAVNGVLYFYNPSLRNPANEVCTSINETGDI